MTDQISEYNFVYYLDDGIPPSGLFVAIEAKNLAIMSAQFANARVDWNDATERLTYLRYKGETLQVDLLTRDEAKRFCSRLGRNLDMAEDILRKSWERRNGTPLNLTPPEPALLERRGGPPLVKLD